MPRVVWRPEARESLAEIVRYIAERHPSAAHRMAKAIEAATLPLIHHPHLFKAGRVPGTRELVAHPNYVLVYRVDGDVEIINVLHARQQYP